MDINLGPDTSRGLDGVPGDSGRRRGLGSLGGDSEVPFFFDRVLSIKMGGGPLFLGWGFAGGGSWGVSGAGVEAFFFRFGADFCFILELGVTRAMSMLLSHQGPRQASTRILTKTQKQSTSFNRQGMDIQDSKEKKRLNERKQALKRLIAVFWAKSS